MRRRRRPLASNVIDIDHLARAIARPGVDSRQWISYGTVDDSQTVDGKTYDSVEFDDDYGPLVNVTLHPGNTPVMARVGMPFAGNGEGSYSPFIAGDEVLVAIPEGDESAGCVVIARLNNAIDKFPKNVGGQDTTKNTFGFTRRRTPHVEEYASTYMVRVASHGGFFLISDTGTITIRDGAGGALQIGPDIFGYMEAGSPVGAKGHALSKPGDLTVQDPTATPMHLQLDLTGRRFTVQVDDAVFTLNSSKADNIPGQGALIVNGELTLGAGGKVAQEHVATVEFVLGALETALLSIAAGGGIPALAAVASAIASGGSWSFGTLGAALATGLPLAAAKIKPPAAPTGVQMLPGLGAVFVKTG